MPTLPGKKMQFASALSRRTDTDEAAQEIITSLRRQLPGSIDLITVFFTSSHQEHGALLASQLRQALNPGLLIGCNAESIIGGDREIEREPGISALAASLPGVILTPFQIDYVEWQYLLDDKARLQQRVGLKRDRVVGDPDATQAFLILGDPYTTPITELLEALDTLGGGAPATVGGMAAEGSSRVRTCFC